MNEAYDKRNTIMSQDWERDLDNRLEQKRRKALEKARKEEIAAQRAAEAEHQRKLQNHYNRFTCCYPRCISHSEGPSWNEETEDHIGYFDWDTPTGMGQCTICDGYACTVKKHIHRGICRKCYEKGLTERPKSFGDSFGDTLENHPVLAVPVVLLFFLLKIVTPIGVLGGLFFGLMGQPVGLLLAAICIVIFFVISRLE